MRRGADQFFRPVTQLPRLHHISDIRRERKASPSGVCFTLDPVSGNSQRVVVNANFGLGESVVSGRATPDTFVIDKTSRGVTNRQVATKVLKIVPLSRRQLGRRRQAGWE